MPVAMTSIHVFNFLELAGFLVLWIVLFECAHVLVALLRHGPLIGWAVSPLGVTVMFLYEPSTLYIWLNVLFPALISGFVIYVGFFSSLAPISFPRHPLIDLIALALWILVSRVFALFRALS